MMKNIETIGGYNYDGAHCSHAHAYLLPRVETVLADFFSHSRLPDRRVFDLGCGNGSVAHHLSKLGYELQGVDPSEKGIRQANAAFPELPLERGSAYEDLAGKYGRFPAVISLEVVEHVFAPRDYAKSLFDLVLTDGIAILSTPYHGYIKNVALAVSGKLDDHFTALWDHGHIKFWSVPTLSELLKEVGFSDVRFLFAGRIYPFSKSMIAVAHKPLAK